MFNLLHYRRCFNMLYIYEKQKCKSKLRHTYIWRVDSYNRDLSSQNATERQSARLDAVFGRTIHKPFPPLQPTPPLTPSSPPNTITKANISAINMILVRRLGGAIFQPMAGLIVRWRLSRVYCFVLDSLVIKLAERVDSLTHWH